MANSKTLTLLVVIHLISNVLASFYLITTQVEAKRERLIGVQQRDEIRKQNDYIVCILRISPELRNDTNLNNCRKNTIEVE